MTPQEKAATIAKLPAAMAANMMGGAASIPYMMGKAREAFASPYEDWQDQSGALAKEMDVEDVPIMTASRMQGNAFYSPYGLSKRDADALGVRMWDKLTKDRKAKHGVIVMGHKAPASIVAHEMGHATQNKRRGKLGRKLAIPFQNISSALSLFGALGGALLGRRLPGRLGKVLMKRPGALKRIGKALAGKLGRGVGIGVGGLGTGYAMNYPRLSEEWGASTKAHKALAKLRGLTDDKEAMKRLKAAYRTYQLGAAIPTLSGTAAAALPI